MSYLLVSSVQQYTIDRLRVSFSNEYPIDILKNLSFMVFDSDMNDISDKFLSINDSNNWDYTTSSNILDIVLNKGMYLPEGIYTFKLREENRTVYESEVTLNYMEDIRTKFLSVEPESLDTLVIKFSSLYEDNIYQTREMLALMNFSCIDESGISYSDVFESFSDVIARIPEEDEPITEVKLSLLPGKVLPKGYYTVRLTSRYKSRTFSILEHDCKLNFMTTTPPTITSSIITKKSNGEYVLTVTFGNYIEKSMLDGATRLILRSDGKNVSSYFNADRISTTTVSTAGVSYVVRFDIPLNTEYYILQKGKYIITYVFSEDYVDDISSEINTDWCLKQIPKIDLFELDYLTFKIPESIYYSDATKLKYQIELDGLEITDPEVLDAFSDIIISNPNEKNKEMPSPDKLISNVYISITNRRHLKSGLYSFIFYMENDEATYKYIGYFDFKAALTPKVTDIYQSDVDRLTVELQNPLPIEVIEYCTISLFDEYGNIDFSDRLESIHDSNIWEPGQTTADRFYVMISNGTYLSSGRYHSSLLFGSDTSAKFPVNLTYMETRKGIIKDIIQKDLSNIEIQFSEEQTRRFLLTTKLLVERKSDGADFTDRFELLENVIKADQYIISNLTIPMNHGESLPAGRYTISFIWETDNNNYITVYAFDVELGYMTSSPPEISTTSTFIDSDGLLNLRIQFSSYLELDLYHQADISLISSDDVDIISKMQPKEEWKLITTSKKNITVIKNITMKAKNSSFKFERDSYDIVFSWADSIKYLDGVTSTIDIDYILPLTVVSEVVSLDTTNRTARMYFEFDQVLQYAFFENLKVLVFDENGLDQTSIFDTIQHSNNIGPDTPESQKVPTNNINLNILNINDLSFGNYTFIFYHEKDGVKTSEYKSILDIMAAISPSIKNMEQVGIDTLLINLKASVPRMILETDSFRFFSFKNFDYTDYFKSIDESNSWDESVREISSFYVKLKNEYKLDRGSYSFIMFAGDLRLDQCDITIEYMEGASVSIEYIKHVNLSTIEIGFSEEQSTTLFKTLELQVFDSNGTDVSYKFNTLLESIISIDTDYFETLNLKLNNGYTIPTDDYIFNIIKVNKDSEDSIIMSEIVPLKYMSTEYPLLYEVTATKLYNKNDGILMTFFPALELDLFINSNFTFTNISGMSVLDRFEPISNATLDTIEKDGVTYINSATLEFDTSKTLNRDKYIVGFNWIGEYSYMKNLSCEVSLDYILFPVRSIELVSSDTIEVIFNEFLKNSYLRNTELIVKSIYKHDGEEPVITEVDFSGQFKDITDSNDFDNLPEDINKITLKLKENITLPDTSYRFIIAEKIEESGETTLKYAYSGTLDIDILISTDILETTAIITQVSYDTLKVKFDKPQNIKFLNCCTFEVVKTQDTQSYVFTSRFKSIKESNRYDILDDDGNIIGYDYFIDKTIKDIVIDEIHYTVEQVNFIYIKLNKNSAISKGTYEVYFSNNNNRYYESTVTTMFMTQTPPKISKINLEDGKLAIDFNPFTELETVYNSSFEIMTNKGLDQKGNIIGDNVTELFESVIMSELIKHDTSNDITYVKQIRVPVLSDAMLASGQYHIAWKWGESSFLPDSEFDGSINVYAKDIKSALTYNFNMIKVVLDTEYSWKFIKNLDVNVINSKKEDCSDLFMSIVESNPEIDDNEKVDSFFIMVADGETVLTETYTFSLSYDTTDIEGNDVITTAFVFMMNIIYLADEFPNIKVVDNLSSQNYSIQLLNNMNLSSVLGNYVQLLDSEVKEILTKTNATEYIDKYIKVFDHASIDRLTIIFDQEVNPCLLNALTHTLVDSEGNDVSSYFDTISNSNTFTARKILNAIKFTFRRNIIAENISNYEFNIITSDGIDLSDKFMSIDDSNPEFNDDTITNTFILKVNEDDTIESYNLDNLKIIVTDFNDERITGFNYTLLYKDITTTNRMDMKLLPNTTIAPSIYDLRFSYQNEPMMDDAVSLYPFSYNGELPFLSTDLGMITYIEEVDLSTIHVVFSKDLPTSIFGNMSIHVYNEDKKDFGDSFDSIDESNNFALGTTLSELETPYAIKLHLSEGNTLQAGLYTIDFEMKISANDSDDDPSSDFYLLWTYTHRLNYMTNVKPNSITDVIMEKIDTLKVCFEEPVDLELIRNFNISMENNSTGYLYNSNYFTKLTESNNFGKYVLLTDNANLLISDDGISWERFNTGKNLSLNDIYHDKEYNINVIACSNGKVLVFDKFLKTSVKEFQTPTNKNLNSVIKVGAYYFFTGNDGVILRGEYTNGHFIWSTCITGVTKTITKIANKSETELVAVGYSGTILYSNDIGITWKQIHTAISSPTPNLTDVIYYDNYTDESGNVVIPENPGFYITGTNGTLLYSSDGSSMYTKVSINTYKSLYSIAQKNGNLIAVGDSGIIIRSIDTVNWRKVASEVSYSLKTIEWCDSKFIICGSSGKWLTSISGEYWSQFSSINSDTLKNAKYLNSQYDNNRQADYVYLQLNSDYTIGSIHLYTGTYVPTLTNTPANYWVSDSAKRSHVGDIFTVFEAKNNTSVIVAEYQFAADKLYDGDDEYTSFYWKDCTGSSPHSRFSGEYTLYIHLSNEELWNQKEQINLTYLTSDPGIVTKAEIKNPANDSSKKYVDPYLHIAMENGDEEAIYYASYEIIDVSGNDYTNRFMSLHSSDLVYSSSLKISGVNIPRNFSTEYPPSGMYTIKWHWTPNETKSLPLSIKTISNIIGTITRDTGTSNLVISFTRDIDSKYFYENDPRTGMNISEVKISMYEKIGNDIDTSFNYFSLFKPIEETNTFTLSTVNKLRLELSSGNLVPPGSYIISISNNSRDLDDDTNMYTLSGSIYLEQELCTKLPDISMAKLVNYKPTVISPVKGAVSTNHYGTTNPYENNVMMLLLSEWVHTNQLDYHIGDVYTNTTTNDKYIFKLDKISGSYIWERDTTNPCLAVLFGGGPLLETSLKYVNGVRLESPARSDITSYINANPDSWDYETMTVGENRFVTKIIMGVNRYQNFYGASDVKLSLYWKDGCIYNDLSYDGLTLPAQIASYGAIKHVYAIDMKEEIISGNTEGQSTDYRHFQAITVEFTQPMLSSMLTDATFDLIYKSGDEGEIGTDYSNEFATIREANSNVLLENETVTNIYLTLRNGGKLPAGIYTISIHMEKVSSEITGESNEVVLTGVTDKIPWLSTKQPSDISLIFEKVSPFKLPALEITFTDGMPAYSSCRNAEVDHNSTECYSIKVVKQNDQIDYTDCFVDPKISKAIIYNFNNEEPNFVESITIPMHVSRCLPKGVYDVVFTFPKYALLQSLPGKKNVVRSFEVKDTLISTIGKVSSFKAMNKNTQMKVAITLNDELSTNTQIKNSQLGKALKVKSVKGLLNKLDLVFTDDAETRMDGHLRTKKVIKNNEIIYTLKNNNLINPGAYSIIYNYNGYEVVDRKSTERFKGLIKNTAGGCLGDSVCYIIRETHGGKTRLKVYSKFDYAISRINAMEKANIQDEEQLAKCKKCRAKKFIGTKTIKANFDKFNFPKGSISVAVGTGLGRYYKLYAAKNAKCSKAKFVKLVNQNGSETHWQCETYQKAKVQYEWELLIANKAKGSNLRNHPDHEVHLAYIGINNVELIRVYGATKKGKTTKKCDAYIKKLKKYIKTYKKQVSTCNACKKREIANKSNSTITWSNAIFDINVMNKSTISGPMKTKFNTAFKKKKYGCKKANFTFSAISNAQCKLSCSAYKKSQSLSYGNYTATFKK